MNSSWPAELKIRAAVKAALSLALALAATSAEGTEKSVHLQEIAKCQILISLGGNSQLLHILPPPSLCDLSRKPCCVLESDDILLPQWPFCTQKMLRHDLIQEILSFLMRPNAVLAKILGLQWRRKKIKGEEMLIQIDYRLCSHANVSWPRSSETNASSSIVPSQISSFHSFIVVLLQLLSCSHHCARRLPV